MVVNPSLPMIPLFTLAGYLLAEGGAPRRLMRVFNALFGGLRGGAAVVTVLACAFFTSFSGASGVTIIALGGMLMPLLLGAGYSPKRALGLLAGAGSLGGLLPPGLPLVLYAIVARVSIEEMFLAGSCPACCWSAWSRSGATGTRHAQAAPRASPIGARRAKRCWPPSGSCSCRWSRSSACSPDSPRRSRRLRSPRSMPSSSKSWCTGTST